MVKNKYQGKFKICMGSKRRRSSSRSNAVNPMVLEHILNATVRIRVKIRQYRAVINELSPKGKKGKSEGLKKVMEGK